jgi:transcriptional regulator with XRE-family HTH domain
MTFADLHRRLVCQLQNRVRGGELTERGLARLTGISQPHIHNVLKGKRFFSTESSDIILRELNISVLDLIGPEDLPRWHGR